MFLTNDKTDLQKGLKTRVSITLSKIKKGSAAIPFGLILRGLQGFRRAKHIPSSYYTRGLRKVNNREYKKEPPVSSFRLCPRWGHKRFESIVWFVSKTVKRNSNIRRGASVIVRGKLKMFRRIGTLVRSLTARNPQRGRISALLLLRSIEPRRSRF